MMTDPLRPDDTFLDLITVSRRLDRPLAEVYTMLERGELTGVGLRTDQPRVTERHLQAYLRQQAPPPTGSRRPPRDY
jgi:hypothetical protein